MSRNDSAAPGSDLSTFRTHLHTPLKRRSIHWILYIHDGFESGKDAPIGLPGAIQANRTYVVASLLKNRGAFWGRNRFVIGHSELEVDEVAETIGDGQARQPTVRVGPKGSRLYAKAFQKKKTVTTLKPWECLQELERLSSPDTTADDDASGAEEASGQEIDPAQPGLWFSDLAGRAPPISPRRYMKMENGSR